MNEERNLSTIIKMIGIANGNSNLFVDRCIDMIVDTFCPDKSYISLDECKVGNDCRECWKEALDNFNSGTYYTYEPIRGETDVRFILTKKNDKFSEIVREAYKSEQYR